MSKAVVLASNNAGKLKEFAAMFAPLGLEVKPQGEFEIPEADETGLTFVENAILKARNACAHSGLPAIADDSGLEVDALGGAPGIYSARFSGQKGNDGANNAHLLEKLADVAEGKRTARYRAVLVYMRHADDPAPIIAEGTLEGVILREARGENGFGYDPLFFVPEQGKSAAELLPAEKNAISHRAKALKILLEKLGG